MEIFAGSYPGGMGTTCIFVILCTCVYFVFRKSMAWQVSLSMIVTVAVFGLFIPRIGGSLLFSMLYELTASSYIFAAVFIAGDLINAPSQPMARITYGVLIGVFTMQINSAYSGAHKHLSFA